MDDLISRQDVLNILKTLRSHNISVYEYDKWILGMPSAEPERKTGKWIKYDGRFKYNWICSECDSCSEERTDYCPMCGAKMEVEE